jgi:hypothetical protein
MRSYIRSPFGTSRLQCAIRVKPDYREGVWIENHPDAIIEVGVSNEKELEGAVERLCGEPLHANGPYTKYRAQAWPVGGVRYAHEIKYFFSL